MGARKASAAAVDKCAQRQQQRQHCGHGGGVKHPAGTQQKRRLRPPRQVQIQKRRQGQKAKIGKALQAQAVFSPFLFIPAGSRAGRHPFGAPRPDGRRLPPDAAQAKKRPVPRKRRGRQGAAIPCAGALKASWAQKIFGSYPLSPASARSDRPNRPRFAGRGYRKAENAEKTRPRRR